MKENSVVIEKELYNVILRRITDSQNEFESVDEYINYILKQILIEEDNSELNKEETKKVEAELKKLGYL